MAIFDKYLRYPCSTRLCDIIMLETLYASTVPSDRYESPIDNKSAIDREKQYSISPISDHSLDGHQFMDFEEGISITQDYETHDTGKDCCPQDISPNRSHKIASCSKLQDISCESTPTARLQGEVDITCVSSPDFDETRQADDEEPEVGQLARLTCALVLTSKHMPGGCEMRGLESEDPSLFGGWFGKVSRETPSPAPPSPDEPSTHICMCFSAPTR